MLPAVRHAWGRIRTIARPFAGYEHRWQAVATFAVIVVLLLTVAGLNVGSSYFGAWMMNALEQRNAERFTYWLAAVAGVFGVITIVQVFARFNEERLTLLLRD